MRKDVTQITSRGREQDSYEDKYSRSLFKKAFVIGRQTIGHVAKDGEDTVVIFSESGNARYDIPKSEVVSFGGTVSLRDASNLENYRRDKDSPLPEDRKKLRASAEEIREAARDHERYTKLSQVETRANQILRERQELEKWPREATRAVSMLEGYTEQPEPEIVREIKDAAREFRELLSAGSRIAAKKAKDKKREANEKLAQQDADKIANMGNLAARFTEDYDRILDQIRSRPYSEQRKIYDGLLHCWTTNATW